MTTKKTRSRIPAPRATPVRAALRGALMAVVEAPAAVVTSRLDVVAVNRLGQALLAPVLDRARPNLARFVFLDEDASIEFYPEWDRVADEHAQRLRAAAAADPNDKALHRLIGELSTASSEFLARWSTKRLGAGRPPGVTIRHPLVGELELVREDLAPVADPGLTLRIYTAGGGTATDDRLSILGSWIRDPSRGHPTVTRRARVHSRLAALSDPTTGANHDEDHP